LEAEQYNKYVEYGFCIRPATTVDDAKYVWDCMAARTDVDIKGVLAETTENWSHAFKIFDKFYAGESPTNLETLVKTTIDADKLEDWRVDNLKSSKTDCKAGTVDNNFWCTDLNVHWFRNWRTAAAPDWNTE